MVLAARTKNTVQEAPTLVDKERKEEHLDTLHEAIIITWGICLLYRERARDHLQEIEAQGPIAPLLYLLLGL